MVLAPFHYFHVMDTLTHSTQDISVVLDFTLQTLHFILLYSGTLAFILFVLFRHFLPARKWSKPTTNTFFPVLALK